jgi:Uma2 family endonuclease
MLVLKTPYRKGKVVTDVPAVVVEIKSPDDTLDDIMDRCFDYEKLAVNNILVMDPDHKRAWRFKEGSLQILTGESFALDLGQASLEFPFAQLFAGLDE